MIPPKKLWVIVDMAATPGAWRDDGVLGEYPTRREAREHCAHLNQIKGYEPTCRVFGYELSAEHKGTEESK